jgi:hypothetical protein
MTKIAVGSPSAAMIAALYASLARDDITSFEGGEVYMPERETTADMIAQARHRARMRQTTTSAAPAVDEPISRQARRNAERLARKGRTT